MMRRYVLMGLLAVLTGITVPHAVSTADLGTIDFSNSGAPEAQEAFIRAVLLLHSFEYTDAREAFIEAQKIDPEFALAYWGEAMTHNHPLWRQQDREAALAALGKYASTPEERKAKTSTQREGEYLETVEILFGIGDKVARDIAYSEALGKLASRYPDDLEARAFYALSILGTVQGVRDVRVYMQAGAVAEEVFAANGRHPGAAHYMIHSYDDPDHAALGLRPARVYAQIAPAAAHAQHMISHIHVALGEWADSVDANVKSFDVSVEKRERKKLGIDKLNYHALHWLMYSYLQLGRFEEAKDKLGMMTQYARKSGSSRALWYHAAMRSAWIVETGGLAAPEEIKPEITQVTGAAADLFATGYAAYLSGDIEKTASAAARLGERHDVASAGHLCGQTGGFEDTSKKDLVVATVMQKSLEALVLIGRGDTGGALALLDEATALEESLPADFGPPQIVKPSHELYGEVLLELGSPEKAKEEFEMALRLAPRRSLSLAGLAVAARATSDTGIARKACDELTSIYDGADESVARPDVCAAGALIGKAVPTGD